MSKVVIPSDNYKQFAGDFKLVKKLNLTGFIQWVRSIHSSGYNEGWNAAMDAFKETNGGINIDESIDAVILDEDELRGILLSVKGIGMNRTEEVMRIIGEKGSA